MASCQRRLLRTLSDGRAPTPQNEEVVNYHYGVGVGRSGEILTLEHLKDTLGVLPRTMLVITAEEPAIVSQERITA